MKLGDFFHKIIKLFKIKKHNEREYQIKNTDIRFFDIPYSCYLVIKKYGPVVFFYKLINYIKLVFQKYQFKFKNLFWEASYSFKREGFLTVTQRIINYIFYGKGVFGSVKNHIGAISDQNRV